MPKKKSTLAKTIESLPIPDKVDKKTVSFSSYYTYKKCHYQWYLKYIKNLRPFTSTINTVFGTAMHETLQEYFRVLYTESGAAADRIDLEEYLYNRMIEVYTEEKIKNNDEHFTTEAEIHEFYQDGLNILDFIKKKRNIYFKSKGIELLGIELHILHPSEGNPNVYFEGFIDITLYDKDLDKVIIFDFKTSKKGWSDKYEKKDEAKIDQLLWYKRYFSKQYEFPEDKIDIVFQILKRKIYENAEFPIPRIQSFIPANGSIKMKKSASNMEQFINECFTLDGDYNLERPYLKMPSESNCKFCPFNNDLNICDKKNEN